MYVFVLMYMYLVEFGNFSLGYHMSSKKSCICVHWSRPKGLFLKISLKAQLASCENVVVLCAEEIEQMPQGALIWAWLDLPVATFLMMWLDKFAHILELSGKKQK